MRVARLRSRPCLLGASSDSFGQGLASTDVPDKWCGEARHSHWYEAVGVDVW